MKIGNYKLKILSLIIFTAVFFFALSAKGQGAISPTLSINPGSKILTVKPG